MSVGLNILIRHSFTIYEFGLWLGYHHHNYSCQFLSANRETPIKYSLGINYLIFRLARCFRAWKVSSSATRVCRFIHGIPKAILAITLVLTIFFAQKRVLDFFVSKNLPFKSNNRSLTCGNAENCSIFTTLQHFSPIVAVDCAIAV